MVIILILLAVCQGQQYQPYFPRMFYTPDRESMIIKFDTFVSSPQSHVTIEQGNRISKFSCVESLLSITQESTFSIYIHRCQVKINPELQEFSYTVIMENGSNNQKYTVHIPQEDQTLYMVALADWGPIIQKNYTPLNNTLQNLLNRPKEEMNISGLMIVGDIGYELYTDECQRYLKFMEELTLVSRYWPIIFAVGNHELYAKNFQIFQAAFEVFGQFGEQRMETFEFWKLKIIVFNPYNQIYHQSTPSAYQKMKNKIIQEIEAKSLSTFVMIVSHYPLTCSEDDDHCRGAMKTMPDLYSWFSQSKKVDFYLGAHMHQYERIYPYINDRFVIKQSPYERGQLPSVVEGVAGNDQEVEDRWDLEYFSAAHVFNKTGLGLMKVENIKSNPLFTYTQISTEPFLKNQDEIRVLPYRLSLRQQ